MLSRDARFQDFVLRSTLRLLQAAAAGELPAPLSGAPCTVVLLHFLRPLMQLPRL